MRPLLIRPDRLIEHSKNKKDLTDVKESVQYHRDNVDEVNKKLDDIDWRAGETKLDKITEDFVSKTKNKLPDLEHWSRPNNFVSMGFKNKLMKYGRKVKAS